jgi:hypothetical protein
MEVDDELSTTSENPVQNKVITNQLNSVIAALPQLYESLLNKVTELSENSTDTEYPSAKCVYDLLVAIQGYIDTELSKKLNLTGGTLTGTLIMAANLNMQNRQITNLAAPIYLNSAATKGYVDTVVQNALIVDTEEAIP